ncbi:hypothetical protein DAH66_14105 [Sphingomonas koreensis]|uniref:Uncharacterized protein n=1 Tax=Sphingomonas koreensis TaxID=93064 RepID=A0A430G1N8_9SPHN|nr:hypothetical protein DAH66_14105 [Sphingomonas koreensis]
MGWASALFRHEITHQIKLIDARRPYRRQARWRDIALPVIEAFLGDHIADQRERHARAQAFGLVTDGECRNLPIDRWLIDASLLHLLEASCLDIREAARTITTMARDELTYGNGGSIWVGLGDNTFIVEPNENGLPIISTLVDVGRAVYEDRALEFPDLLPEVVMTAASGRRLGEIIATSVAHLDARRIERIIRFKPPMGGWRNDSRTQIRLKPDYVPLI